MSLKKQELLAALAASKRATIKLVASDGSSRQITIDQAFRLASSGEYETVTRGKRFRSMRETPDARTPHVADASHWDGRGCIRFWGDPTNCGKIISPAIA